jgi:1-deoxy-D-xylulose-5-phosphate reductoisomerase
MKTVAVLGSTGSVGRQTLEVCRLQNISPVSLSAYRNITLLEEQARYWKPECVAVGDAESAHILKNRLSDTNINVFGGTEGVCRCASIECDMVVNAVVGMAGLKPALAAIRSGNDVAIANKEALVTAGTWVMREAKKHNTRIIPVDSEHSAIFQCLQSSRIEDVESLVLTASGGPFYGKSRAELKNVTPEQTLRHPCWHMGPKISVDSATLMNKGFEIIEAMHLFGIENIDTVIHRQCIIHSIVNFRDGASLAQMGQPDMRVALAYALNYPHRNPTGASAVNWRTQPPLTFEEPDYETFGCLKLAVSAAKSGAAAATVLNAVNELAVAAFLEKRIRFLDIEAAAARALDAQLPAVNSAEDCLALDEEIKERGLI